ncbi:MAG: class I SAM-dependent methyltransferase [Acidimicrobiales bacterium]
MASPLAGLHQARHGRTGSGKTHGVGQGPWAEYDSMAASFADHAAVSAYNAHYDRPSVMALCGDVSGCLVLDACCGPGLYAAELLDRGASVVAFDASEAMVDLARERVGGRAEIHRLVLGEALPFPDASFDLVVCALAIHHLEDREAGLRELYRVVRAEGAVVLSTQHPTADWLRKGGSYFDVTVEADTWVLEDGAWNVTFWREPLTSLCDAVYRAGFLIERLVEPLPAESMRERWPEEYDKLTQRPGFLNLRLVKRTPR